MKKIKLPKSAEGWLSTFRSSSTVRAYRFHLSRLAQIIKNIEVASMDSVSIAAKKIREDESLREASWNQMISAWRSYFGYLVKSGRRPDNPAAVLRHEDVPDTLKPTLTKEEVGKIWTYLLSGGNTEGRPTQYLRKAKRDRCLICLLVATGMRVNELCLLKIKNLDMEKRHIAFRAKGNRMRRVAWPEEGDKFIIPMVKNRGGEDPLLPSMAAGIMQEVHLQPGGVTHILNTICDEIGIPRYSAHAFRRFAITQALEGGQELQKVSRAAGHKKLQTTIIYDANRKTPVPLGGLYLPEEE